MEENDAPAGEEKVGGAAPLVKADAPPPFVDPESKIGACPAADKTLDELREELVVATKALETAKANLANEKDREKLDYDTGKIVSDYRVDYPALKLADDEQRGFFDDEKAQLEALLSPTRIKDIADIAIAERKKIEDAKASIVAATTALAARGEALVTANAARDAAKVPLDLWKKPAASIKERLKAVDAFKAEIFKADEAGQYALAYWLLTDSEKLSGKRGDPKVITPEELKKKIMDVWAAFVKADADAKALDAEVKTLTKSLDDMKGELGDLTKNLEAVIRQRIAELPPEMAATAPVGPTKQDQAA